MGKDHLGDDMRKVKDDTTEIEVPKNLDEGDIAVMKSYGIGPYTKSIKSVEKELNEHLDKVNDLCGIKESDTGLAHPGLWDLAADKQMMSEEHPLQVARCTKIIQAGETEDDNQYMINVKQIAKFVVALGEKVAPTDIEEGMFTYQISI